MSFRNVQENNVLNRVTLRNNAIYVGDNWMRNPSWQSLSPITSSDQKFTGLYKIDKFSNFAAFSFTTSAAAQYTIDWGDGSALENVNSGIQANHTYDYNDVDLAGTDAPVTFTDSTDTVGRVAHGYLNGTPITFATVVTTTGIVASQVYFVINATANTFQVSATAGGSPLPLTTDGTGTLLTYKQAVITVTPVSGNFTAANLYLIHNTPGLLGGYSTGWLDIAFAGSYTGITLAPSSSNVRQTVLQQVSVLSSALTSYSFFFSTYFTALCSVSMASSAIVTSMASMFLGCSSLTNAVLSNTGSATSTAQMFQSCVSLINAPMFNTASVTDMNNMFNTCSSLTSVPVYNTSAATIMSNMFTSCASLTTVPLFNTASAISMANMFNFCYSLDTVPLFNTATVTTMAFMFSGCPSLVSVPRFNTPLVTQWNSMFLNCLALEVLPQFNMASASNLQSMCQFCRSLTTVPPLTISGPGLTTVTMFDNCSSLREVGTITITSTGSVSMTGMFSFCASLIITPQLNISGPSSIIMGTMFNACPSLIAATMMNTSAVTNMQGMFQSCPSLTTVPLFDTSSVTNMSNMFTGCNSLISVPLFNTSLVTNFGSMFSNCFSLASVPAFSSLSIPSSSGFTSMLVSCFSASEVNVVPRWTFSVLSMKLSGAQLDAIYTNLPKVYQTGPAVTFTDASDLVTTVNPHGYLEGANLRFSTITTTTGINTSTTYFVRNPTATTFQLSLTNGGAIINLVNNGTGIINSQPVLFTDSGDIVTLANHGFYEGYMLYFSFIFPANGIIASPTAYFVRNPTVNTFQLSLTLGGAIVPITADSNAGITATVISITVSNTYGASSDTPSIATNKGWTVIG